MIILWFWDLVFKMKIFFSSFCHDGPCTVNVGTRSSLFMGTGFLDSMDTCK